MEHIPLIPCFRHACPLKCGSKLQSSIEQNGGDNLMRLGTFVLGGILGAAAVVYLSDRKNRSMKFSALTSPIDSLGKMMGGKMDRAMNNFADQTKPMKAATSGFTSNAVAATASTAGANGLEQVEKIVSEDPQLKQTVNEILSESGKGSTSSVNLQ